MSAPAVRAALLWALAPAGLAALWLLYGGALEGWFLSDDFMILHTGAALAERGTWEQLAVLHDPELLRALPNKFYRPLTHLSFAWCWRAFGLDPFGHHLVNLGLHALNAALLGGLVWTLARDGMAALLAAVLLALHPTAPESVAWMAARYDPLCAGFVLGSLWAFAVARRVAGGRRQALHGLALVAMALALCSKEPGVLVAPLATLLAWWAPRGGGVARLRALWPALRAGGVLWGLTAAYFVLRWALLGTPVGGHHYFQRPDLLSSGFWLERLGVLATLLAPVHLERLSLACKLAALLVMLLALGAGFVHATPRRRRLMAVAGGWVVLGLAPGYAMDVDGIDLFGVRILYLSAAALCAATGIGVASLARRHARSAWALAALLPLGEATLARVNLTSWTEAAALSEALHDELGRLDPAAGRVVVADVPATWHGALLGMGAAEQMVSPLLFPGRAPPPARIVLDDAAVALLELAAAGPVRVRRFDVGSGVLAREEHLVRRDGVAGGVRLGAARLGRLSRDRRRLEAQLLLFIEEPAAEDVPLSLELAVDGGEVVARVRDALTARPELTDPGERDVRLPLLLDEPLAPGRYRAEVRCGLARAATMLEVPASRRAHPGRASRR